MANNRYISFIESVIQMTKENKFSWKSLISCTKLSTWFQSITKYNLMDSGYGDSFYTYLEGHYIVLLVRNSGVTEMYVIPNTFKKIIHLEAFEYGELITRLSNLVKHQLPSAEEFINKIIEKQAN